MSTLNISIPEQMREWIDIQVQSGLYANASDYLRDLIRHDQSAKDAINLALAEGERSGFTDKSVNDIAKRTKAKIKNGDL